jgi:hypothetical protein
MWNDFQLLATNFLANDKADNCKELVKNFLLSYYDLGCNMSLKILFLNYHQDIFPETCGTLSSEHGEFFHYILIMEKTYQGKWSSLMLAEYCWMVTRDSSGLV